MNRILPNSILTLVLCCVTAIRATASEPAAYIQKISSTTNRAIIDTAALELQRHLRQLFAIDAVIGDEAGKPAAGGFRFVVGGGPDGDVMDQSDKGKFAITIRDGSVWLRGYDRDVMRRQGEIDLRNSQKGSLQAVYQFLYEFGGVRWLLPGDENTVLKNAGRKLELPESFNHIYSFRFARSQMDIYAKRGDTGNHLWRNMCRLNIGESNSFIHYWGTLIGCDRYYQDHPEYYPLINGVRTKPDVRRRSKGTQVCTSNPAVADIFATGIVAEYRRSRAGIIPAGPNDGGGFCECAECLKLDRDDLYTKAEMADLNGKNLSDRVYLFMNEVARKVRAAEPDAKIGMHLYSYYVIPPRSIDRFENNIYGEFCIEPAYFNDREYKEKTLQRLREWHEKGLGGIAIFLYHGSYYWGQTLHVSPHAMAELIKAAAALPRVIGVKTESNHDFGPSGLDYYVYFALINDPDRNVDEVIDEFCALAYGPAAEPMKQFYTLAENTFMARDSKVWKHYAEVAGWYDQGFFDKAYALLEQARKAAAASPDAGYRARIELVAGALDHTRNLCDFIRHAVALRDYGVVIDLPHLDSRYRSPLKTNPNDPASRRELIDATIKSYERLTANARKLDGSAFFYADDMLRTAAAGNWEDAINNLKLQKDAKEVMALSAKYPFQPDPGNRGEAGKWYAADFNAGNWKTISLNAPWEKQGFDGYDGVAWYRIPVRLPLRNQGDRVELCLGAVDESCKIWVNGEFAGEFIFDPVKEPDGWNVARIIDITPLVSFRKINQIAVRVEDKSGQGGIWRGGYLIFKANR